MGTEAENFLGLGDSEKRDKATHSERYPALRIMAAIYRALAILTGIAALVILIIGIVKLDSYGDEEFGIMLILGGILGGTIGVITCLAAAEGIKVFLDIEDNTRRAVDIHGGN